MCAAAESPTIEVVKRDSPPSIDPVRTGGPSAWTRIGAWLFAWAAMACGSPPTQVETQSPVETVEPSDPPPIEIATAEGPTKVEQPPGESPAPPEDPADWTTSLLGEPAIIDPSLVDGAGPATERNIRVSIALREIAFEPTLGPEDEQRQAIHRLLRRRLAALRRCYEASGSDAAEGAIRFTFVVSQGRVTSAAATENTIGQPTAACSLRILRQFRFNEPFPTPVTAHARVSFVRPGG